MSLMGYRVETSVEKALLIGDLSALMEPFITKFQAAGIEPFVLPPSQNSEISSLLKTDLDYCLIFGSSIPHIPAGIRTFVFLPLEQKGRAGAFPAHYHLCYYHDFVGKTLTRSSLLEGFLSDALTDRQVTIPGDGLQEYHLSSLDDLIAGFLQFVFSTNPPRELILINPEGISLLSLAYRLRSLLPYKIDIIFDENKTWSEPLLDWNQIDHGQSKIGWRPQFSFEKDLKSYLGQFPVKARPIAPPAPPQNSGVGRPRLTPLKPKRESTPVFVPIASPTRLKLPRPHLSRLVVKLPRPRLPAPARIAVSSLVLAFSLYLFSLLASLTITALTLRRLAQAGEGDLLPARASVTAQVPAVYLQANLTALSAIPGLSGSATLKEANSLLSSYILGLKTLTSAEKLGETSRSLAAYILSDSNLDLASYLSTARLDVDGLYNDLSLLDGSLPPVPPSLVPTRYRPGYSEIKTKLQEGRRAALSAKSLLAAAPDILGIGSRRKYAILFQNNMELRGTGGFIGSFGIISLENGKLFDIQVYDVYAADGQLKGHVEPPEEIKKYLGEATWFLRDSNWDPDFPTTARRVEWFLGKTISAEVQGTIAINVNTLQDILRALGPLTLTDYNETVTADNIFERAEYHAEVGFFPGSTQKKEFIGSVADSLLAQTRSLRPDQSLGLARALTKSIDEKNTLFSLDNQSSGDILSTLGWNGEVRNLPCPDLGGSCTSDYAMLVDSNFGINKANYFLRRSLSLDTTIHSDRSVAHVFHVDYTNTSTSGAWPAGAYKSYSRLYLPAGSVLYSVKVGEQTLTNDQIKISTEHGKTIIGFLINVPINSNLPVEVAYTLGEKVAETSPVYSFYWQKQSGTQADPLKINVNYPLFMVPEIVSPQGTLNTQQLQFNLSNVTDRRITVKFK